MINKTKRTGVGSESRDLFDTLYLNHEWCDTTNTNNEHEWFSDINYTDMISALSPPVTKSAGEVEVEMEDGSIQTVSWSELVKYIRERQLRSENDVVRSMWDRYQVAAKLVRSTDDGNEISR